MGTQQTTLHDFTLNLLSDLDARAAFQADPEGTLNAAGLGDVTAGDIHDILPLVLDTASVVKIDAIDKVLVEAGDLTAVDQLKAIAGNVDGVTTITDVAAPSAITALVTDVTSSDFTNVGDVSSTLDATVLKGNDVVSNVSDLVYDNTVVTKVTDVADVKDVADVLVKDIDTDVLVKDVVDSDIVAKDVADVLVKDVADIDIIDNVVQNVAQVGDVHNELGQVIGDVKVSDIDVLDGGVGNGNDVDIHF